ncbi:hypothetical protein PsorP6_004958 [Peronosclerospora sorghi]|uniref:Uncharacterized protein n=1 Tax=Peronosclerospora sorghi TaxID=230839 RepID=A0ACC0W5N3_9STRA|nr:hypothetical protein PsorP6_004958 [Peronosclerospora sorghi]
MQVQNIRMQVQPPVHFRIRATIDTTRRENLNWVSTNNARNVMPNAKSSVGTLCECLFLDPVVVSVESKLNDGKSNYRHFWNQHRGVL